MAFYIPNIILAIPRNPVVAVGLPLVLGFVSGAQTSKVVKSDWYVNLPTPPAGRPPRLVFPFVWTLLYLSMGYASHLAVNALDSTALDQNRNDLSLGIALYYAQLGLNFLWSSIFFGKRKVGLALVDLIAMLGCSAYMTKLWDGPTGGKTSYLLLPYCVWLAYATYINAGIWLSNSEPKATR